MDEERKVDIEFVRPTPKWEPRLYPRAGRPGIEAKKQGKKPFVVDGVVIDGADGGSVVDGDAMAKRDLGKTTRGKKRDKICWACKRGGCKLGASCPFPHVVRKGTNKDEEATNKDEEATNKDEEATNKDEEAMNKDEEATNKD